jgi:hypothetical protein
MRNSRLAPGRSIGGMLRRGHGNQWLGHGSLRVVEWGPVFRIARRVMPLNVW